MPTRRKSKANKADIDAVIDEGGSVPEEKKKSGDEKKKATIRFPKKLLDRIDQAIDEQMFDQSRNQWMMKAAIEKLERDQS